MDFLSNVLLHYIRSQTDKSISLHDITILEINRVVLRQKNLNGFLCTTVRTFLSKNSVLILGVNSYLYMSPCSLDYIFISS